MYMHVMPKQMHANLGFDQYKCACKQYLRFLGQGCYSFSFKHNTDVNPISVTKTLANKNELIQVSLRSFRTEHISDIKST